MWFRIESNHRERPRGDRLTVSIQRQGDATPAGRRNTVTFVVPPDFHTHNDSVAAALMTLIGKRARGLECNFPISAYCAALLREYYELDDVGPVDPGLEPRRPGSRLALNFSGGLDSSALRALLDQLIPGQFTTVSTGFEGHFEYEEFSRGTWPPDLRCQTDFRRKGFSGGRFTAAVPLLFADYLDLYALTSGHVFSQDGEGMESNIDGHPPTFLRKARAYQAGGLEEVHLLRGVDEVGVLRILMRLVPERLAGALLGASDPGTTRNLSRGLALRILHEWDGLPAPPCLDQFDLTPRPHAGGQFFLGGIPILFVAKHYGAAGVRALSNALADLTQVDFSFLDDLSMDYPLKYNTNFIEIMPDTLRDPLLRLLFSLGVEPYAERDWTERLQTQEALLPQLMRLGAISEEIMELLDARAPDARPHHRT